MAPPDERHRWSHKLENVLEDRDALEAFKRWMKVESPLVEHPINLHFAIIAYKNMCACRNVRAAELARNLHQKYVSMNTGVCSFLQEVHRREVSSRVHALSSAEPDSTAFDILIDPVEQYLRQQHAQFVSSEEFLDAFNRPEELIQPITSTSSNIPGPPPNTNTNPQTINNTQSGNNTTQMPSKQLRAGISTQLSGRKQRRSAHQPTLTAEMLLKTQYDRENALGESELEKLYPPVVKAPYVCNATTSKNDSAVSSTFSSDANGQNTLMKLSTIREEQLRGNPATHTLARVERVDCTAVPTHCTEEGRRAFANLLIEKLNVLSARRRRNDVMSQQLRDIESRKCSAREVVKEVEPNAGEEEDELERYVRQRMADDSNKPSPSYHSPDSLNTHSLRFRRRSPKSSSPERFQYYTISPAMHSSYSGGSNPYGSNGFAPPPCGRHASRQQQQQINTSAQSKTMSRDRYELKSMAIYDTSGIESMAPSSVSEREDAQRAAVFQKARLLSSGIASAGGPSSMRKSTHRHHDCSSLPRTRGSDTKQPAMTISYREKGRVPMVAHVPAHPITFKEFRKYLGISSKCNLQFFFKTVCEDASSPYQLLLVNDDSTQLPIYEGRVTAECKSLSDSE